MKENRNVWLIRFHALIRLMAVKWFSKYNIVISEYPKSGGSWFAEMLCDCLDSYSFRRNKGLRSMRHNILHGHYNYDSNYKNYIMVIRDGRDVMVSAYYHFLFSNSRNHGKMHQKIRKELDINDVENIRKNLPAFIEYMCRDKSGLIRHLNWNGLPEMILKGGQNMCVIKYENLLIQPEQELERTLSFLKQRANNSSIQRAIRKNSFTSLTNRNPGEQDIESFVRKGIAGDWKNHFTEEAVMVFKKYCGDALIDLGYERCDKWSSQI
jgi:hypothetical protein